MPLQVNVYTWEGDYKCTAYVTGMEYVKGYEGWFTSLVLLTPHGEKIEGWKHMLAPMVPMLEYDG